MQVLLQVNLGTERTRVLDLREWCVKSSGTSGGPKIVHKGDSRRYKVWWFRERFDMENKQYLTDNVLRLATPITELIRDNKDGTVDQIFGKQHI